MKKVVKSLLVLQERIGSLKDKVLSLAIAKQARKLERAAELIDLEAEAFDNRVATANSMHTHMLSRATDKAVKGYKTANDLKAKAVDEMAELNKL